jgi:MSHA biogenesis protein MshI
MIGFRPKTTSQSIACFLSNSGYSLVGLRGNSTISFCENHYFSESPSTKMLQSLRDVVDKYELYGHSCQVILSPSLYQLHLMDSPEVPENEVAKALRWQLKGLIDYPINDIIVEAFLVPPHGYGNKRKKVFAAITLQSGMQNELALLKSSYLDVSSVSIAELALCELIAHLTNESDPPSLVVSFDDDVCQLHVHYGNNLYLFRTVSIEKSIMEPQSPVKNDILLEIQRSIDYCLMELKLPEPKKIFFTPSFYNASDLFVFLNEGLGKEVQLMDMSQIIAPESGLTQDDFATAFYALGGALMMRAGR